MCIKKGANKKEMYIKLSVIPQAAKVIAMVHKCLAIMEMNLLVEDVNGRLVPNDSNMLFQKALCLHIDSRRDSLK
jgi:hypothetical protein